jgi:hypothetical protein
VGGVEELGWWRWGPLYGMSCLEVAAKQEDESEWEVGIGCRRCGL